MKALIDGDILRYEVGFAAEAAARHKYDDAEALPDFGLVENILWERITRILENTNSTSYELFITQEATFREMLAVSSPYKGHRVSKKPWHFNNLTAYMLGCLPTSIARYNMEADDEMALAQTHSKVPTVICSRDKDLRQVNGWQYSWELGNQPSFGPFYVDDSNTTVFLSTDRKQLKGWGVSFFYGQLLVGDRADNILGLPGCGPVMANTILSKTDIKTQQRRVYSAYESLMGERWKEYLTEQGRLLWLVRRLGRMEPTYDGLEYPVIWEMGMELEERG